MPFDTLKKSTQSKTMENTNKVAAQAATTFTATSVYDTLPDTQLTEHFKLREFIISATAVRHGIDNTPPSDAVERLEALSREVLEPLRRRFGAIRITSGYRSERVNRLVGGAASSQHLRGEAADISIGSLEVGHKMYDFIRSRLDFDQLIFERRRKTGARWLHVSYRADGKNRHEAFAIVK